MAGRCAWAEEDSGKLARLRDITEVVAARQEKALVFTQFRRRQPARRRSWAPCSGAPASSCTAKPEDQKRRELVRRFQEDDNVPFFVLSLKAGGAGLNLTAASHVIHFDRWWNPAVKTRLLTAPSESDRLRSACDKFMLPAAPWKTRSTR